MPALSAERWRALSQYLDHAFDLGEAERAAWLESLAHEAREVAADVRLLLEEHEALDSDGFLELISEVPIGGSLAGQVVGAYTLVSPIGQGGMGTVWLADRSDGSFAGRAAGKLLNVALIGRAVEERFRREGSILTRLTHANIAHLLDAGVSTSGQPRRIE